MFLMRFMFEQQVLKLAGLQGRRSIMTMRHLVFAHVPHDYGVSKLQVKNHGHKTAFLCTTDGIVDCGRITAVSQHLSSMLQGA